MMELTLINEDVYLYLPESPPPGTGAQFGVPRRVVDAGDGGVFVTATRGSPARGESGVWALPESHIFWFPFSQQVETRRMAEKECLNEKGRQKSVAFLKKKKIVKATCKILPALLKS